MLWTVNVMGVEPPHSYKPGDTTTSYGQVDLIETAEVSWTQTAPLGKSKLKSHTLKARWSEKKTWHEHTEVIAGDDERITCPQMRRVLGVFTEWGRIEAYWDLGYPLVFVAGMSPTQKAVQVSPNSSYLNYQPPPPNNPYVTSPQVDFAKYLPPGVYANGVTVSATSGTYGLSVSPGGGGAGGGIYPAAVYPMQASMGKDDDKEETT